MKRHKSILKLRKNLGLLFVFAMVFGFTSCKKFLDIGAPVTTLNQENVFSTDLTATQVITGFYASLSEENMNNPTNPLVFGSLFTSAGVAGDELTLYSSNSNLVPYYTNAVLANSTNNPWSRIYNYIFRTNIAIQGLEASDQLTLSTKNQLLGECKFFRAFCYFYLVNLYGDVPIPVETDPEINRLLGRSKKDLVYQQIFKDLNEAVNKLSVDFLDANLKVTSERTRPTQWAAKALLSRAYLYHGDYLEAENAASSVIENNHFDLTSSIDDVFKKNSQETIWALQPVFANTNQGYNTGEGKILLLPVGGPNASFPVSLSSNVVDNFEHGDMRKTKWTNSITTTTGITYNYASKYKANAIQSTVTEYSIVLRLGEVYLIRAEARAKQGQAKFATAVADLNKLRSRARALPTSSSDTPLPALSSSMSQANMLSAIERERFSELFTEWGHRWLDLKRTPGFANPSVSRADELMPEICAKKGGVWSPNWKLWPIPMDDLLRNPNMQGQQNPGYN